MAETLTNDTQPPNWFVKTCKRIWKQFAVGIPGKKPAEAMVDPEKEIAQRYLTCMRLNTEMLTGIPAGLLSKSVRLDQVFIPVQFRPNRTRADYPFTVAQLENYRTRLKSGGSTYEVERTHIDAEKNWQDVLKHSDRMSIADLWQRLSREQPVAVIQGYPGMGKSTLMQRLTLHMALCGLGKPDPEILDAQYFKPPLIPILLRLGKYATACVQTPELSLEDYLNNVLTELDIPGVNSFIQQKLRSGHCLVLLDGLDEVSDLKMREQVQEAIRIFVRKKRDTSKTDYNRFLITSRIAGYDQAAFPGYMHFTIAALTSEQIDYFLLRWPRAYLRQDYGEAAAEDHIEEHGTEQAATGEEVERKVQEFATAVKDHLTVGELAQNPLLLTLLVVMQQNSIALPRQRVELYKTVTSTLLENRNIARDLDPIPEKQAIQHLGSLAIEMQEQGNSFARELDVMDSLVKTIGVAGGTPEDIAQEAELFLKLVRERGGLFVQHSGDSFEFSHRTFQEYFAARYMLNTIKKKPVTGMKELVKRARRRDDLWRETFLLAVAYQSNENEKVVGDIIRALLAIPQHTSQQEREHDVMLAAECLIESKPLSIDAALEKQIANQLLQTYEEAQRSQRFEVCDQVEVIMCRWLLSLPTVASRALLLAVLYNAIIDTQQIASQRATLTLLTMIAQQLTSCPQYVFEMLIPPLLALAGLPAVAQHQPMDLAAIPDPTVADLALSTLSFMGKQGPAGLLLADVRQHFKDHPEHMRLLARLSLECGTLLTLTVVPSALENYRGYASAVERWIKLREHIQTVHVREREIDDCRKILQALLDCAEEVCYPSNIHLLNMLQLAAEDTEQPWQENWQDYLLDQLNSGVYISYQEAALLWEVLFPEQQDREPLATLVLQHFNSDGNSMQRYAQRLLATLGAGLRTLRNLPDRRELRYVRNVRGLRDLRNVRDLRKIRDVRDLQELRNLQNPQVLQDLQDLRDLRDLLLTQEVAERAATLLSDEYIRPVDKDEQLELLTILLGRVLQIVEAGESGNAVEDEIQQIVEVVHSAFTAMGDDEMRGVALDVLSYLPVRSAGEIKYVLRLAENTEDERVQGACAKALRNATPRDADALAELELGKASKIEVVREAVEERLEGWAKQEKVR